MFGSLKKEIQIAFSSLRKIKWKDVNKNETVSLLSLNIVIIPHFIVLYFFLPRTSIQFKNMISKTFQIIYDYFLSKATSMVFIAG